MVKTKKNQTVSLRLPAILLRQLSDMASEKGIKLNPLVQAILQKVVADKSFSVRIETNED